MFVSLNSRLESDQEEEEEEAKMRKPRALRFGSFPRGSRTSACTIQDSLFSACDLKLLTVLAGEIYMLVCESLKIQAKTRKPLEAKTFVLRTGHFERTSPCPC